MLLCKEIKMAEYSSHIAMLQVTFCVTHLAQSLKQCSLRNEKTLTQLQRLRHLHCGSITGC